VYDLAGNVWEWCSTRWQEKYDDNYSALRGEDEWSDRYLEGEDYRVLRGGSYHLVARNVRGAYRYWSDPRNRFTGWGFRCVLWL
jgi:formylglycine-generating enzyme required for sulfatase activity